MQRVGRAHQGVCWPGLEVLRHTPTSSGQRSIQIRGPGSPKIGEVVMAADQGEEPSPVVMAQPQARCAATAFKPEVHVHRPVH